MTRGPSAVRVDRRHSSFPKLVPPGGVSVHPSLHAILASVPTAPDLGDCPLPSDTVGLLDGMVTTRAVRRSRAEPVLRAVLFAATRAPSGSNRQPFRFLVLTDGPKARQAKALIGDSSRRIW